MQLRSALAIAYEAPVWQRALIDQIAQEIAEVEQELSGASKVAARPSDINRNAIHVAALGRS